MKKVIGGSIAIILGLFCFSVFFSSFLTLLAGTIPLMLILIGCLIIYLKRESEPEKDTTDKPIADTPKFLGNTGTLIFHSPDCKFSKSEKCTAVFDTREKAVQENYKPCGICKP